MQLEDHDSFNNTVNKKEMKQLTGCLEIVSSYLWIDHSVFFRSFML